MLPPLTYFPFLSLCRGSDRPLVLPPEAVPRLNEVLKDSLIRLLRPETGSRECAT